MQQVRIILSDIMMFIITAVCRVLATTASFPKCTSIDIRVTAWSIHVVIPLLMWSLLGKPVAQILQTIVSRWLDMVEQSGSYQGIFRPVSHLKIGLYHIWGSNNSWLCTQVCIRSDADFHADTARIWAMTMI